MRRALIQAGMRYRHREIALILDAEIRLQRLVGIPSAAFFIAADRRDGARIDD